MTKRAIVSSPAGAITVTQLPGVFYAQTLMVYNTTMPAAKFYGAAAQYNKPPGFGVGGNLLKIAGIVVAALVLLTAGYIGFNALTSGGRNDASRLVARERVLLSFLSTNQSMITSDDLKTVNSNAISLQTSDVYALQQGLKSNFSVTTIPDDITKSEADTTSAKTLATAKTQGRFDQAYVQLLRDKIATLQSLENGIFTSSNGSLKTAVQTNLDNLKIIDEQLAKLDL